MLLIAFSYDGKFSVQRTIPGETVDSERYQEFVAHTFNKFRLERTEKSTNRRFCGARTLLGHMFHMRPKTFFRSKGVDLPRQSSYSPDLNGCDRWVNKFLKKQLKATTFHELEALLSAARQNSFISFKNSSPERTLQIYWTL